MADLSMAAQVILAASIFIVWVLRFDNVVNEFKQYRLSDLTRTLVGSAKIVLATLIVVGIWHDEFVLIPSLLMAFLMLCAQYFHFKENNPWMKRLPSLLLLLLCMFIASVSYGILT